MANGEFFVRPAQYGQSISQFGDFVAQERKAAEQAAYAESAKRAMAEAFQSGDPAAIRQAVIQYPEIAETATQMFGFTNDQTEQVARETYRRALSDPENAAAYLDAGIETVSQFGGRPSMMTADLQMLQENPEAALKNMRAGYAAIASEEEYNSMFPESASSQSPAGVREFESMIQAAESDNPTIRDAALVNLGLKPRAGLSAEERILQSEELTRLKVELEQLISAAKEEGKLETQLAIAPKVRGAIKEAEQEAQSRGEKLSEFGRAQAAMPGLQEVVGKLKTLSDVATYTMGGKVFDTIVKELGFGATKGATARAKMESLVNNQILPLLRDTFGAQFTEREGEQLRRTMLDIDAAPEQKKEILDSFIEQKMRDLEMKEGQADVEPEAEDESQAGQRTRIRLDAEGNIIQ